MGDLQTMSTSQPTVVIIGPSGSGKSSVVRGLADRGLVRVHPTWTTRPRRADEQHGSPEHRFVSERAFDDLEASGFFLDTVAMFGLPHRYGLAPVPAPVPGRIDLVMLRAPLIQRFAAFAPQMLVYQIEDTADRVHQRLLRRDCGREDLVARLADNRREVALGRRIADRVFVNEGRLEALVDSVGGALRGDVEGKAA
jgi:guanylate kinase